MDNNNDIAELNARLRNTLMDNLGIIFIKATKDYLEATMPVDHRTQQPFGCLHGGASIALAETVAGSGSHLVCGPGYAHFGLQVSASHVSSAPVGDQVLAKGTPIHLGRSTHVWNVDVVSMSTGKLISSVRVTNYILPPKA